MTEVTITVRHEKGDEVNVVVPALMITPAQAVQVAKELMRAARTRRPRK